MSYSRVCGVVFLVISVANLCSCAFDGQECLDAHNTLRQKHLDTKSLKYSLELAKEAQKYAEDLALSDSDTRTPTRELPKRRRREVVPTDRTKFHKEDWDGEILFPDSQWDLNKNREIPVGESIHKFCCYSFPYCPRDFFHDLNFPPSAKGVVNNWYKEIKDYDFKKGGSVSQSLPIRHFTNIVWKKTAEIGCGQSKRSKKGCIFTVTRYRIIGSSGDTESFKQNVGAVDSGETARRDGSGSSVLVAFVVTIVIIFIFIALGVFAYIKRERIKRAYDEWNMKHQSKKAEAALRRDYDEESFRGKRSIIYKPSSKKTRPSILVVPNAPLPNTVPLEPREPVPTYENLVIVYQQKDESVSVVEKQQETKKSLPQRPTSPVKADLPAMEQAHFPVPPSSKPTVDADSSNGGLRPSSQTETETKNAFTCPKALPNKPLLPKKKIDTGKPQVNVNDTTASSEKPGQIRAPIPAPRPPKSPSATDVPKPAPRPQRPAALSKNQFQSRAITPGRASKKNPNFRTLPINDRGSLRRPEKPVTSNVNVGFLSSSDKNGNDKAASDGASNGVVAKKALKPPMAPPKKGLQIGSGEKPSTAQNLKPVVEERPASVAEMRRLLEQKNQR